MLSRALIFIALESILCWSSFFYLCSCNLCILSIFLILILLSALMLTSFLYFGSLQDYSFYWYTSQELLSSSFYSLTLQWLYRFLFIHFIVSLLKGSSLFYSMLCLLMLLFSVLNCFRIIFILALFSSISCYCFYIPWYYASLFACFIYLCYTLCCFILSLHYFPSFPCSELISIFMLLQYL